VRRSIQLGRVQETALIPLYARALESRRRRPILEDPKAVEIVDSIDWDFRRFGQRRRVVGCTLRSAMFDVWVREFLQLHPDGTVVEIGAGLNTRFERLDNGKVHWYDLDLPDIVGLRRKFFLDSDRRVTLAASVLDRDWIETVRRSPAPYFLVAETVFVYLEEAQVKAALGQIANGFPQMTIALDTVGRRAVEIGNRDFTRRKMAARFQWACEDPIAIQDWNIGLRLLEARTVADVPDCLWPRLSFPLRANLRLFGKLFPKQMKVYQLGMFDGESLTTR
jgi:O-methyltransferase involved in polyketide biosynthesis